MGLKEERRDGKRKEKGMRNRRDKRRKRKIKAKEMKDKLL